MNDTNRGIGVAAFAIKTCKNSVQSQTASRFFFETQRSRGAERESILIGSLCSSFSLRFKKEPANQRNRRPYFAAFKLRRRDANWWRSPRSPFNFGGFASEIWSAVAKLQLSNPPTSSMWGHLPYRSAIKEFSLRRVHSRHESGGFAAALQIPLTSR